MVLFLEMGVQLTRQIGKYFSWSYENFMLVNTELQIALTIDGNLVTTNSLLQDDDSQKWILDYNGTG